MTEFEMEIYMLLLWAGRTEEAEEYKAARERVRKEHENENGK